MKGLLIFVLFGFTAHASANQYQMMTDIETNALNLSSHTMQIQMLEREVTELNRKNRKQKKQIDDLQFELDMLKGTISIIESSNEALFQRIEMLENAP